MLRPDHGVSQQFTKINQKARRKKIVISLGSILGIFVLYVGFVGATDLQPAKQAQAEALKGKEAFERAQAHVLKQEFPAAKTDLAEAQADFEAAQQAAGKLNDLKIIPVVRRQILAIDNVLEAGVHVSIALQQVCDVGQEITSVLKDQGDVSLKDISPEQKREMLKKLFESPPALKAAQAEIDLAVAAIDETPDTMLFPQVKKAVQPLKENLPILKSIIDQAIPLAETIPVIVGYPTEKTYLFLLQNNGELRPTGGFIGTYGIVKLKDGEISQFHTDNIYNIDNTGKDITNVQPPEPIKTYTLNPQWLMRDSNWSPDFPTAAQKVEEFYHAEGGPEQQIDGTIAVTPTLIESLLALTGPVSVNGISFSADNFFELLEKKVEQDYAREGISDADRKEIIGSLSTKLMDKLLALPKSRFQDLWQTFVNNVNGKQILIYLKDPEVQQLVKDENWAGEVKHSDGDYLFVVDANLAALKTDTVIERNIEHNVSQQNGSYVATTTIHYKNTGSFTDFTTRYRTYTRIYIPLGSQLVSADGYLSNDRLQGGEPTQPTVSEDLGYTVIGGFTAIEPGDEGNLTVSYTLPDSVAQLIKQGTYTLYAQKQAGTAGHGLGVDIDFGRGIQDYNPLDNANKIGDNRVRFETDLSIDRKFSIQFK